MKTPSFILGASLIFWGWQTNLLIPAVVMALVLEGSRLVTVRWDFAASDFNRISDLCTVIFLGMLIYSFASKNSVPVSHAGCPAMAPHDVLSPYGLPGIQHE
jgi:hypothetical protein